MGKARRSSEKRPQRLRGGYPLSPGRGIRVRKALFEVQQNNISLRESSKQYGFSFGFLQRRFSGEVEVDRRKGPRPVFNKAEEEAMATWLREMAERGMGLKPQEFLDFVQGVVRKEGKPNNFKDGRPGHDWYYAFMARNADVIEPRKETPLEMCRAKVRKTQLDTWFVDFRTFLSKLGLIDKPQRIWNADETGFSMGSVPGRVIGPLRSKGQKVPHISGGQSKQRHTVMFCGNANGDMIPPFFVYPEPKPKGYNPMTGGIEGSKVSYTKKGWMDTSTFKVFLAHFDEYAGTDRPVVLLVDGVSSHVDLSVFQDARNRGIELYRLVANATHLMQPLDKGVFGPLKTRWHQVVRKHTRENPGCPIGKETFAEKLKEAFLLFYKPLTVINSFRSAGIYPVDSTVISSQVVKPSLTFSDAEEVPVANDEVADKTGVINPASEALETLKSVLDTPTKNRYQSRIDEGWDITGTSPCFDAYRKLHLKAKSTPTVTGTSVPVCKTPGLDLLADTAVISSMSEHPISPVLQEALVLPKVTPKTSKRKALASTLPDNLTSNESIRAMALKSIEKLRVFAEKEAKAKEKYIKESSSQQPKKAKIHVGTEKIKEVVREEDIQCMGCHMTWGEDVDIGDGSTWIQCDDCDKWIHADCCSDEDGQYDEHF